MPNLLYEDFCPAPAIPGCSMADGEPVGAGLERIDGSSHSGTAVITRFNLDLRLCPVPLGVACAVWCGVCASALCVASCGFLPYVRGKCNIFHFASTSCMLCSVLSCLLHVDFEGAMSHITSAVQHSSPEAETNEQTSYTSLDASYSSFQWVDFQFSKRQQALGYEQNEQHILHFIGCFLRIHTVNGLPTLHLGGCFYAFT